MMFGGVMMLAFWGGLIVLVVLLVRWLNTDGALGPNRSAQRRDALDILRERFAHGEIDEEEFKARRKALEDSLR